MEVEIILIFITRQMLLEGGVGGWGAVYMCLVYILLALLSGEAYRMRWLECLRKLFLSITSSKTLEKSRDCSHTTLSSLTKWRVQLLCYQ